MAEGFDFHTLQNHSAAVKPFRKCFRTWEDRVAEKCDGEALANPGFALRMSATDFSKPGFEFSIPATVAMAPALNGLKGLKNKPFSPFSTDTQAERREG